MAEHELSILVRAKGAANAAREIGKVDSAVGRLGNRAGEGVRNAGANIAKIGIVAGAGIALMVRRGLQDLATLESAVTSVDGAIAQMGMTGKVTGAQIAGWANEIEADIGAAFDDKEITGATAALIRFGRVTDTNLRQAMVVMTDLAVKTGSVESASTLLGKALADPTKAAGKLSRAGVVLTKQQQKQITAMVEAGKVGEAQALILDAVAKSTTGAAAASQGPYQRSLSMLADVTEDAQKALAEGFLPVITKVSDLLSKELAKPSTLQNIREFGKGLASGLDSLISIAQTLPWGAIGTSLKVAGAGAQAVLSVFTSMPPWVQTAVLTSWGLNKLTGGALGGIIGELGKGLIKGVLGMNAGVVNIKAGVVNGGGMGSGAAGAAGKGMSALSKVFLVGEAIGLAAAVFAVQQGISAESTAQAKAINAQTQTWIASQPSRADLERGLAGVEQGINDLQANPLLTLVQGEALTELRAMRVSIKGALSGTENNKGKLKDDVAGTPAMAAAFAAVVARYQKNTGGKTPSDAAVIKTLDLNRQRAAAAAQKAAADAAAAKQKAAQNIQATKDADSSIDSGANRTVNNVNSASNRNASTISGAIRANRPIVTTNVKVNVSAGSLQSSVVVQERYGPANGSRGNEAYPDAVH